MADEQQHEHEHDHTQRTLSVSKLVLIGFLIIAGYFLLTEHRAHTIAFLPYLLLLACPLMHIFMHGGHGGHGGHHHSDHETRDSDDRKGDA